MGEAGVSGPPLLVFADDWGRHPSSCQHLIGHLLDRHPVCWVNTIGTRKPRLDWATLRRGMEKTRQWLQVRRPDGVPARPQVLNPILWPWFGSGLARRLNRRLLLRQLGPVLRSLPAPPVAVTTLPLVADLVEALPVERWVYYCVDDFGQWPGLDGTTLRQMEERLLPRAHVVIAASETLQERLRNMGRAAALLTHGVDLRHWIGPDAGAEPPELAGLERPLIVFWGVIDRRMDVAWVRELAGDLRRGTVLLVGPEADADPSLSRMTRVVRLGPWPYRRLPQLAGAAAVLVMPYADLPVTRAMQPLKLQEYLATGRPVVAADLPAVRAWSDCLDVAASPGSFSRLVRLRVEEGLPPGQRRARERLSAEGWAGKARVFERLLAGAAEPMGAPG